MLIPFAIAALLLAVSSVHATPPAPPPTGQLFRSYSLTESASLVVESSDIIIEGELASTVPRAIYSDHGCQFVTELTFTPLQIIMGRIESDSLRAWTMTMPDYFSSSDCTFSIASHGLPLPPIGAKGVFRFRVQRPWLGPMQEALVFDSSEGQWLPFGEPVNICAPIPMGACEFVYQDFVSALMTESQKTSFSAMISEATFIAVVKLGPYHERRLRTNENGEVRVTFPVSIEEVLRGVTVTLPPPRIVFVEPSNIREDSAARVQASRHRRLGKEFYRLQSRRVLAMGSCQGHVITVGPGIFEVTDQDTVLFGVSGPIALSDLRTRLR